MTCEETQQAFSLYADDMLALPVRAACDEHLRSCPVCRAELTEMRSIIRGLGALPIPAPPADLASSISDALMIEAAARQRQPALSLRVRVAEWLRPHLMPYTVGAFASTLLFIGMFAALRTSLMAFRDWDNASRASQEMSYRILYVQDGEGDYDINKPVSAQSLSTLRAPFATESPSLNPRGALAALTRSHAHTTDGNDDMIVVTDVFSNGSASLADVVQAPRDPRMLDDFQHALRQSPAFVPASFDRRPQTMRVVFVIQKVDVHERNF
ncbi:MAG TPA: zf-HC2 domain-containing protein [Pyrinomonadaceae bacterium]